ncbi:MAG: hypothetical protein QG670_936 [Thermoproteota archaeon]|nr:hypothetical protein [Thermoproteota archaeon]
MIFTVQVDNPKVINEALASSCNRIRFGPEFCEWKIADLKTLEATFSLTREKGKEFAYVTPHVSSKSLEKLKEQLIYLNDQGKTTVVVNDLGVLNQTEQLSNLKPYLGRQLITALGRCPWKQITEFDVDRVERGRVEKTFYQTSLNYEPTIQSFKENRIQGADVDWIPQSFPYYDFLADNGLEYSIHLHSIPVTITRRCHMARFLDVTNLEKCPRPCYTQALRLKNEIINLDLFLHGNTVFRLTEPTQNDINRLYKTKVSEFVITMSPLTKINTQKDIDALIQKLTSKPTLSFFR